MEKCELHYPGRIDSLDAIQSALISNTRISTNYLTNVFSIGTTRFYTIVLEKYDHRNKSYASATISMLMEEHQTTVSIIISGAGNGVLNISLFATTKYLDAVKRVFLDLGFSEVYTSIENC